MEDDLVPEIVPILQSQNQSTTEVVPKVTIQQLFDAQLPVGKDVSYSCHFIYKLTHLIIQTTLLYLHLNLFMLIKPYRLLHYVL